MQSWDHIHTFRYTGLRLDLSRGVASFGYLMQGSSVQYSFTDVITFPLPKQRPDAFTKVALDRVLELLYIAVGLIYYKSMAPRSVVLDTVRLAPAARRWTRELYRSGLAEFAYRYNMPHVLDLTVDAERGDDNSAHGQDMLAGGRRPLVAIGGGKDSIVSVEALKAAKLRPVVFTVERQPTPLLSEVMALTEVPNLTVRRTVDQRLTHLLDHYGAYLGHVPVTAIHSLVGVAVAVLHGLGPVVMSNERSAAAGNLIWRDHQVNHQWSKGVEAEVLLREAIGEHAGLSNASFSLLSGMSELYIARLFAGIDTYDSKVTSCNYAFRLGGLRCERWCNDCAKCRFVFLSLAPFMDRARLVGIFGQDLLDDPHHIEGYRELLGLRGPKPFECVGEIVESQVARQLLARCARWADAAVIRTLREEISNWPSEQDVIRVFATQPPRFAPPDYAQALAEMQRSYIQILA